MSSLRLALKQSLEEAGGSSPPDDDGEEEWQDEDEGGNDETGGSSSPKAHPTAQGRDHAGVSREEVQANPESPPKRKRGRPRKHPIVVPQPPLPPTVQASSSGSVTLGREGSEEYPRERHSLGKSSSAAAHTIQAKWKEKRRKHKRSEESKQDTCEEPHQPSKLSISPTQDEISFRTVLKKESETSADEEKPPKKVKDQQQPEEHQTDHGRDAGNDDSKNNNNNHDGQGAPSTKPKTVQPPDQDLLDWQLALPQKRSRRGVKKGLRVKVRFALRKGGKRKKKWFGGMITAVSKEGSKIRIKYDDGTTEVTKFPDKDICIDDTSNGQHLCRADRFIPPPEEDEEEQEAEFGETELVVPSAEEKKPAVSTAEGDKKHTVVERRESIHHTEEKEEQLKSGERKKKKPTVVDDESKPIVEEKKPGLNDAQKAEEPTEETHAVTEPIIIESVVENNREEVPVEMKVKSTLEPEQSTLEEVPTTQKDGLKMGIEVTPVEDKQEIETFTETASVGLEHAGSKPEQADPSSCGDDASRRSEQEDLQSIHVDEDEVKKPKIKRKRGRPPKQQQPERIASPMEKEEPIMETAEDSTQASAKHEVADAAVELQPKPEASPTIEPTVPDAVAMVLVTENAKAAEDASTPPAKPAHTTSLTIRIPNVARAESQLSGTTPAVPQEGQIESEGIVTAEVEECEQQEAEVVSQQVGEEAGAKRIRIDREALMEATKSDSQLSSPRGSPRPRKKKRKLAVEEPFVVSDQSKHESEPSPMDVDSEALVAPALADGSGSPRSRAHKVFDPQPVRSGRRAAQQANERIVAKQENVIHPDQQPQVDGLKVKRKKHHRDHSSEENTPTEAGFASSIYEDDSQWVQCDRCKKWRIIPSSAVATLPKQWFCENNTYDPKRASCDAPEQTQKQVAKERKKFKRRQQRLIEEEGKEGPMEGKHDRGRSPRPGDEAGKGRRSPTALPGATERPTGGGKKGVRADEAHEAAGEARRGRGRPRRSAINESAPPSSTAQEEADNVEWVQCEKCDKWRKLPPHISADDLPNVWYCSLNTWNETLCCEDPEDKADGLQDVGVFGAPGATSGKLSYRNLIFGSTGRKANRPVSERARAAESIFGTMTEGEETTAPVVMYSNSSAFVSRSSLKNAAAEQESKAMSFFDRMSKTCLWKQHAETSLFPTQSLASYTFDSLPQGMKRTMKELLLKVIGNDSERLYTGDQIMVDAKSVGQEENVSDECLRVRPYCTKNVVVTALCQLVREGSIECVQHTWAADSWDPLYRRAPSKSSTPQPTTGNTSLAERKRSRCMKISKPWKRIREQ